MTRIALIDHHRVVRSGLDRVLADAPGIEVVASVDDPAQIAPATIDVAVISPPATVAAATFAAAGHLVAASVRVIALLADPGPADVRAALDSGATGVLQKTISPEELIAAIERVARGERVVAPELSHLVAHARATDLGDLSHRESEVLRLIALGHTTPEIAGLLGISTRTVESHRHHILVKLDLKTRADLVRYALVHHLIGPGS